MAEAISKFDGLQARIRETPLLDRLKQSRTMIANMCKEGRPPKMSIPVSHEDEDFFISTTLKDAEDAIVLAGIEER